MPVKSLIIFVIGFLQFISTFPQTPSYYHYTASDGLASSTVYQIIQDRNGFIWFATLNGMSRFDGKRFTTFRMNDGLNSNSIISLAEGIKGELYIGNYEKGINVLRNGHIEKFCNEIAGRSFALSYLLLDPSGNDEQKLYAYRTWGGISSITEKTNSRFITHTINTSPIHVNRLAVLLNKEIVALTPSGLYRFHNTRLIKMRISGLPDTNVFCLAVSNDGSYIIGARGIIYGIKKDQVIARYPINIAGNNDVCAIINRLITFVPVRKTSAMISLSNKSAKFPLFSL